MTKLSEQYLKQFTALLNEGISHEDLTQVLHNRLQFRYPDVIDKYGYDAVENAVSDVAEFHAGSEELGSSDISIMLREIIKSLESSTVDEGFGKKLGTAALAGAMALSGGNADSVVLNPARPINAQGGTVADPYRKVPATKERSVDAKVDAEQQKNYHVHPKEGVEEADQTPGVRTKYRATVEYGPTAADAKFVTVTAGTSA